MVVAEVRNDSKNLIRMYCCEGYFREQRMRRMMQRCTFTRNSPKLGRNSDSASWFFLSEASPEWGSRSEIPCSSSVLEARGYSFPVFEELEYNLDRTGMLGKERRWSKDYVDTRPF